MNLLTIFKNIFSNFCFVIVFLFRKNWSPCGKWKFVIEFELDFVSSDAELWCIMKLDALYLTLILSDLIARMMTGECFSVHFSFLFLHMAKNVIQAPHNFATWKLIAFRNGIDNNNPEKKIMWSQFDIFSR